MHQLLKNTSFSFLLSMWTAAMLACAGCAPPLEYRLPREKYVTDTKLRALPAMPRPDKGEPFIDPVYHTKIMRITDKEEDGYAAINCQFMAPAYVKVNYENADGTYLVLSSTNWDWAIYDTRTWQIIRRSYRGSERAAFPAGEGEKLHSGQIEPRWDGSDPNILYFRDKAVLYKYDVAVDKATVVRDFSKTMKVKEVLVASEGSPSFDCRFWALKTDVDSDPLGSFVYDMKLDKILGTLPGRGNWVGMSPSGTRFMTACPTPSTKADRNPTSYNRTLTDPVRLCSVGNHGDIAIDAEGNEVYVHQCPTDYIAMHDLKTGKETKLISLVHDTDWATYKKGGGGGMHFSGTAYATPGWMLVSMYGGPKEPACWQHRALYLLELKENPRIWRLAFTRAAPSGKHGYRGYSAPHGIINTRGTRIYWSSNWNDPDGQIETYMLILPANWYEELMGESRATALRKKAAALLGIPAKQLMGKK